MYQIRFPDGNVYVDRYGRYQWLIQGDAESIARAIGGAVYDVSGDAHKLGQTAFRLPEDLLAWLREQAKREDRTMTRVVIDALETYRREDWGPSLPGTEREEPGFFVT